MGKEDILAVGTLLDERYEIVKRLGKGGMGSVYLAHDKRLMDSQRAIKQMTVDFIDQDQYTKAIEDFKREAHVLSNLDHPSIPTIYDYFVAGGYYYLVMKLASGKDLEQLLEEAPTGWLPELQVTKWSIQLCDVLNYIHNQEPPIIYRDMKPANVMYDEKLDRITLVDFGIARFIQSSQAVVTAIGTMGYAPPELFAGKVVPASDIYSLGATMYHLLTGQSPQSNPVLGLDFSKNPRPIDINPKISKEMDLILEKAVQVKPGDRFQSAAEMKYELEEHLYRLRHQAGSKSEKAGAGTNARLSIVHCNTQKTEVFPISKSSTIVGRYDADRGVSPDIDLLPFDTSGKISRRHAVITVEAGKYYFEDLGSSNGSLYNGEKALPQQKYTLQLGDQVCIGETVLEFSLE